MECDYCNSGIHSEEDLVIQQIGDDDVMFYHEWCVEVSPETTCSE